MSEFIPEELPEWAESDVRQAREAIGDGLKLGTVAVAYFYDAPESGQVWVRASCDVCPAELYTQAHHPAEMVALAYNVAAWECPRLGHPQDTAGLRKLVRFYFASSGEEDL